MKQRTLWRTPSSSGLKAPSLASSANGEVLVSVLMTGSPWRFPPPAGVSFTPPSNFHYLRDTTDGLSARNWKETKGRELEEME